MGIPDRHRRVFGRRRADLKDGEDSSAPGGGTFWEKPTSNSFESSRVSATIAAVHGPCIGYGLTRSCSATVIASNGGVLHHPEVSIRAPTIVSAIRLPPRVGWANSMELLLTGKPIDVERGQRRSAWSGGWSKPSSCRREAMAWARTLTRAAPLAAAGHQEGGVADR